MISSLGSGAFSYCSRILGRRGPSPLASSRATMNRVDDLSLSAGSFGAAPSNTKRSLHRQQPRLPCCPRLPTRSSHPFFADSGQQPGHPSEAARASRFTVAAEGERQYSKFCRRERSSLLLQALLVERTTVGQHNSSVAFSVNISVDTPPSWVGKDTVFWAAAAPESNNATMTGMSLRTLKMYHHSEVEPCDAYCSVWLDEPEPV